MTKFPIVGWRLLCVRCELRKLLEITAGSDCETGFFAFSHAEDQIDDEANERNG
jgi:hypothetical protein